MGACVPFPFWRLSDIWLAPQNKADGCHRTTTGCVRCIPDALRQYWRCIGQDGLLAEQAATLKGAMAAHALEKIVSEAMIMVFEKGVKYQLLMGIGLLTIGLNSDKIKFNLNPFY